MWFLAVKQLLSRPQQTFLTFIAIVLGAGGYVSFSSLIMGMREFMIDQLINMDGQIKISTRDEEKTEETFQGVFFRESNIYWIRPPSGRYDDSQLYDQVLWLKRLADHPEVSSFAPQLSEQVFVVSGMDLFASRLIGIEPEAQAEVTNVDDYIVMGNLSDLDKTGDGVIAGSGVLNKAGLLPGDNLIVTLPGKEPTALRIIGVLQTGNQQVDDATLYASLPTVQRITGSPGQITGITVKVKDVMAAGDLANQWSHFSKDKIQSWDQANQNIFTIFKFQDIFFNSITGIILLIVSFGIYNILNMVVNQKKKEIAIIKSFGFDDRDVVLLFLYQGLVLGILGSLVGLLVGAGLNYWLSTIEVSRRGFGAFATSRHMMMSWNSMIYVRAFLITCGSALVSSIIPARQGAKLSPIEIIRGAT